MMKNTNIGEIVIETNIFKMFKKIVNNNYSLIKNNYVFSNTNISKEDTLLLAKKVIFKRGNVVKITKGGTEVPVNYYGR